MKKGIIVLLLGLFLTGCSIEQLSKNDLTVTYIEENTLSKDSSYTKILEWLAKKYDGSKEFIYMQDRENGIIVAKGVGSYKSEWGLSPEAYEFNYTLSIRTKDKKTKFEFLIDKDYMGMYPPAYEKDQILLYITFMKNTILFNMENKAIDDF